MDIPGYDSLTEEERAVVDWQYRRCGDFKEALWRAIMYANDDNLELLRQGFPVEVDGYLRYSRENGWWASVTKKAGGDVEKGY